MYKDIQEQFNQILQYSQNLENIEINTDKLFQDWERSKQYFIQKFNGLIYEVPGKVSFTLSEKEKQDRVNSFIEKICIEYGNVDLANFIGENRIGFFENKVMYEDSKKRIPKGMKLVKAFKHFEDDPVLLSELQNEASMIIQEDKIEGTLCFSVHPLDFLSLSENNHNWSSCHSLKSDYRAGNLSLMVDRCTFIAYLKSDKDEQLKNFPPFIKWNSKKWRTLFFLSDRRDIVFNARQYPFSINEQINAVKEYIGALFGITFSEWHNELLKTYFVDDFVVGLGDGYLGMGPTLKSLSEVVVDKSELHYNDILYSTVTSPMWAYKMRNGGVFSTITSRVETNSKSKIEMGGEVMCIHCGQHPIPEGSSMLCVECELKYGECASDLYGICSCCGEPCYIEDSTWDAYDDLYCPNCAEDVLVTCSNCGEHYRDYLCVTDEDGMIYCQECSEYMD